MTCDARGVRGDRASLHGAAGRARLNGDPHLCEVLVPQVRQGNTVLEPLSELHRLVVVAGLGEGRTTERHVLVREIARRYRALADLTPQADDAVGLLR